MKLDGAIEILSEAAYGHSFTTNRDFKDALKLGIEALKRVKKEREIQGGLYNYELLGETEE